MPRLFANHRASWLSLIISRRAAIIIPAILGPCLLPYQTALAKNSADDCHYFAQFVTTLSTMRDSGKSRAETVAFARKKSTDDHLAKATADLFAGEAIGMYYSKREYAGSADDVYKLALQHCTTSDLP